MSDKIYDAFDKVGASERLKSSTKQHIKEGNTERGRVPAFISFHFATVCIMMLCLLGIGGGYGLYLYPVSYVSIDVNPSIEIALNSKDKVLHATAYNEDGKTVLDGMELKNLDYKKAVDRIVESEKMQEFLKDDADLTFTIASSSSEKEKTIYESISKCGNCRKYRAQSYCADRASVSEAHREGMSFGKYAAYLELRGYDDTITVDDCKGMTMSEIHGRIQACQGEHNGNGHHHKKGNK